LSAAEPVSRICNVYFHKVFWYTLDCMRGWGRRVSRFRVRVRVSAKIRVRFRFMYVGDPTYVP